MSGGAITDVAGIRVGHHTDPRRPTGCTVVLCDFGALGGAVGGVDVRGAAPGTRETDLLAPANTVDQVHAVLLAGGSAFGLDAAGGVMRWLEERGVGVPVGAVRVPIVPAAVLYDLWLGDSRIRPDAAAGYAACAAASTDPPAQGSVGAGAGATVGKLWGFARAMKGGIGSASVSAGGITVGALVAVNAVGDVIDRATGRPLAGARSEDGGALVGSMAALLRGDLPPVWQLAGGSTTIGVVATDAKLTKAQAQKVAQMAHDGLARTIDPVHTPSDGDTLFALATGTSGTSGTSGASGSAANLTLVGALAAEAVAAAVLNAVREAVGFRWIGLPWIPALRDL